MLRVPGNQELFFGLAKGMGAVPQKGPGLLTLDLGCENKN
jgi:hypothetical protein